MWPRLIFGLILSILIFALVASWHNMTYAMAARPGDMSWSFLKALAIDGGIGVVDYFIAWNRMKKKSTVLLWILNGLMIVVSIYGNMKYHIMFTKAKSLSKFASAIGMDIGSAIILDAAMAAGTIALLIVGMSETLSLVYIRMFHEDKQEKAQKTKEEKLLAESQQPIVKAKSKPRTKRRQEKSMTLSEAIAAVERAHGIREEEELPSAMQPAPEAEESKKKRTSGMTSEE